MQAMTEEINEKVFSVEDDQSPKTDSSHQCCKNTTVRLEGLSGRHEEHFCVTHLGTYVYAVWLSQGQFPGGRGTRWLSGIYTHEWKEAEAGLGRGRS